MVFEGKDKEHKGVVLAVFNAASSSFGLKLITKAFSKNKSRERDEVYPRAAIWYVLREKYGVPGNSLGRIFGYNHSTITHNVKNAADWISIGDKEFVSKYYKPLYENLKFVDIEIESKKIESKIESLVQRWARVNLIHMLEKQTKEMESLVYNLDKLIEEVESMGYRITRTPETVYVPVGTEEKDLPEELIILRNTYGFMIQTEIE